MILAQESFMDNYRDRLWRAVSEKFY